MVVNKNTSDGYDPGQKNSEDQKFLDFEKPIQDISEKISALRLALSDTPEINKEIVSLENQRDALTKKYILNFQYGRLSKLQDIHKDPIH